MQSPNAPQSSLEEQVKEALQQAAILIDDGHHLEAAQLLDNILVASPRNHLAIALIKRLKAPYSPDFYNTWLPGMIESGDAIVSHLFKHHVFDQVIDFGAGAGAWLEAAFKYGASKITGVEGEWVKELHIEQFTAPINYIHGDLSDSEFLTSLAHQRHDLAICVEVAEHIQPERSFQLVQSLCAAAPTIIFGAALPRQWGNGHINCRPHSFWIDLFKQHGYEIKDLFRPYFWYHTKVRHWYAQNTFLFVSKDSPEALRNITPPLLVDIYHPGTLNNFVMEDHALGKVE